MSVTSAGAKSSSLNANRLKGAIPVLRKPLTATDTVAARRYAFPNRSLTSFRVTTSPGLFLRWVSIACEKWVLNGPIKLTSSGWSLWEQCGGRLSTVTWHSLALSTNSKFFVWLEWPSRIRSTGLFSVGLTCLMKCSNHILKILAVIQPLGLHENAVPGGAPTLSFSVILTLGKMIKGGMKWPVADMHMHAVLRTPRSAEVTQPTCLFPRSARTLDFLV